MSNGNQVEIKVSIKDGEPYAPDTKVTQEGKIPLLWTIESGSDVQSFRILNLEGEGTVFTRLQPNANKTRWTAVDDCTHQQTYKYDLEVTTSGGETLRKDPVIDNDPRP